MYKKSVLIPRKEEIKNNAKLLKNHSTQDNNHKITESVKLHFSESSKIISNRDIHLDMEIKKLFFLAEKHANILSIVQQLDSSIGQFNSIVNEYNKYLSYIHSDYNDKHYEGTDAIQHFERLKQMVEHFEHQVDHTLYFTLKLLELFLQYSQMEFKKFSIQSIHVNLSYKELYPVKLESWENTDYFNIKEDSRTGNVKHTHPKPILDYFKEH